MSVYKPKDSRIWNFDFVLSGKRFHGSTGVLTRRKAEEVERIKRNEAATGQLGQVARLTLDAAAGRYWTEKGRHRGDAVDVERRLEGLLKLFGKDTKLSDINQATIAAAIERRRGMTYKRAKDRKTARGKLKPAKEYTHSNSTVNRDVIETLRPILKRAKTHWTPMGTSHGLAEIDWRELRLGEPRGLSRLYAGDERSAWITEAEALDDMGLAVEMLLTYGLRLGELLFPITALNLDPAQPTLMLQKGRKKDVILYIPLRQDHARQLAARLGRAREAKINTVWFAQGPKGKLIALTYAQVEYRIRRAADLAGIAGERRIHGARHHAATTILRKTQNLKMVQGLLGHASITSSQRYAHVAIEALRGALDDDGDFPRNSPGTQASFG